MHYASAAYLFATVMTPLSAYFFMEFTYLYTMYNKPTLRLITQLLLAVFYVREAIYTVIDIWNNCSRWHILGMVVCSLLTLWLAFCLFRKLRFKNYPAYRKGRKLGNNFSKQAKHFFLSINIARTITLDYMFIGWALFQFIYTDIFKIDEKYSRHFQESLETWLKVSGVDQWKRLSEVAAPIYDYMFREAYKKGNIDELAKEFMMCISVVTPLPSDNITCSTEECERKVKQYIASYIKDGPMREHKKYFAPEKAKI